MATIAPSIITEKIFLIIVCIFTCFNFTYFYFSLPTSFLTFDGAKVWRFLMLPNKNKRFLLRSLRHIYKNCDNHGKTLPWLSQKTIFISDFTKWT